MSKSIIICGVCGKDHAGLPTDYGFRLPDDVWALSSEEKSERAQFTSDLCRFDGRHFIRCALLSPFAENNEDFGWGVFVEVERPIFDRYVVLFATDASGEPCYPGKLANALPSYPASLGMDVLIQFQSADARPLIHIPDTDSSPVALDQRHGISAARYHDILTAIGVTV
jgi:hypothetical protein